MAAAAKQAKIEAHAAHAAAVAQAAADAANPPEMAKSPSDFSCHSYELFVGQEKGNDDNNKEKMSIRSEGLESVSEMHRPTAPSAGTMASKVRKVSTVSMAMGMLLHAPNIFQIRQRKTDTPTHIIKQHTSYIHVSVIAHAHIPDHLKLNTHKPSSHSIRFQFRFISIQTDSIRFISIQFHSIQCDSFQKSVRSNIQK